MCFSEQTESIENFAMGNHPFDMQRESSNSDLKNLYLSTLTEVNDNVILHPPGVRARTQIDTEADMSINVFKPYVGEGILSPNREMVTALVKDVVTAYPSFVRAIQKRCLGPSGRMALPVMFISTYLSGSEGFVTLEDSDGLLWEVEWIAYVQSGRRLTLTIGWPEFASYHNIKVGNALLVEILSFERFRVQIINTSDGAGRPYSKFKQVNKDLVMAGSNKMSLVRGIKEKPTILDDTDVNVDQWSTAVGASKSKVHKQLFSNSIHVKKRKWIWNAKSKEIQVKERPEVKKNSVSRKSIFLHSEKIKAGEIKGAGRNILKKRKMALASFIEEKNTCPGNTIKIPQCAFVEADETCFMNGKVEDIANLSDKARVTLLKSSNCSLNRNPQHPQDKDVLQGSYLMFKPDLERKSLSQENVIVRPASASIKEKPVSVSHLKQIFNKEHMYQAQYCHSSKEKCFHFVLHGFKFCMLHILEDPFAPYRQCEFVEIENKARCYFPVYMNSTHVSFCQMHCQAGDISGTEKYSRDFSKLGSLSLLVLASTVAHIPSQEAQFISFDSQPEHPSSFNASITEQLPMVDALYPSVKMANENLHESNSKLTTTILSKHSLSDKVHKQSHYHSQENDEDKHLTRNVRFPFKDASQSEPLKRSSIGQQIPDGIKEASIGKDHTAEWRVTTHFPRHNRLNVTAEKDNKYSCSTLGFIPSSKASQLHTFGCLVDIGKIDFTRTSLLWTPSHLLNLCGFTENNAIDENAYLQTAPRIVLGTMDASTMELRFSLDEPKPGSAWVDKGCHKIQQTDAVALQYQGRRACCSKFVGVRKRPWGAYGAEIRTPEGKRLWLGTFATEEAAARAYDDAARIFKRDGAVTNFECHDTQHDMHSLMLGDHNLTAVKKDDAIFKEMPKKQRSANGKRKQAILLNRQNDIVDQIPNWQDNETTIMQSDCNASALPEPCGYCDWETSAAISCELNMATEVDGLCKNDMQYSTQSIDKVREIKSLTSRPTLESDPGQKVIKMSDLKFVGTSGQLKRKSSNEGRNGRMFEDKFAVCELNEDESQVGGMVQKDNGSSQYSAVPRVVGMQSIYVPSESCIDRERVGEQFDITQENSKQKVVIRGNMNYERQMVKEANRKDYISDEESIEKDILFARVRIPASRKHETNIDHRNSSGKAYTSTFKNTEMSPQTCSNGTAEKIHLDGFQSMPCSSRMEDKHYGEVILSNQATENGGHYMLDNVALDSAVGSEAVVQQNDLLSRNVSESGKLSNVNDDENALHSSIRLSRSANVVKVHKASKSSAPGKTNYKRRVEFKGVYCNGRKFQAIYYNPTVKKHIYLGTYITAEAAARAYDQAAYKQFGNSDKLNFSIEERDDEAIGNDKTLLSLLLLTKTARKTRTSYVKMDKCARKNVNREDNNGELINGKIQISDDPEKKIPLVSVSDQSKEWRTTASWQKGSTKYVDGDLSNADSRPTLDCKLPDYKKKKVEVDQAPSNTSATEHLDYDAWGQLLKASEVLSSSKIKIETHCPNPF